jgi:hypothetical protein
MHSVEKSGDEHEGHERNVELVSIHIKAFIVYFYRHSL